MPKPKRDGKLVEFQDKPAARSGNTPYAQGYDRDDPVPLTQKDITQVDIIEYNFLKLLRLQAEKKEKEKRSEILGKLAAGATVEEGPHFIELTKRTTATIR